MFHLPIYLIVSTKLRYGLEEFVSSEIFIDEVLSLTSIAVTLCVSSFSFYYFEKPILSLKRYFS